MTRRRWLGKENAIKTLILNSNVKILQNGNRFNHELWFIFEWKRCLHLWNVSQIVPVTSCLPSGFALCISLASKSSTYKCQEKWFLVTCQCRFTAGSLEDCKHQSITLYRPASHLFPLTLSVPASTVTAPVNVADPFPKSTYSQKRCTYTHVHIELERQYSQRTVA